MSTGDELILNIAESSVLGSRRANNVKGGRWTDRVKAKRVLKRKNIQSTVKNRNVDDSHGVTIDLDESPRPAKKTRREREPTERTERGVGLATNKALKPGRPQQIISSLFSYNPEVDKEDKEDEQPRLFRPSNAPLTDRSTFSGLGVDPLIVTHLATKMHISSPTAIQREALPPLLSSSGEDTSDRDVFIQSQTGSGKTLSFLLPVLQDLLPLSSLSYIDRSIGTLAIIIVPTRELAKQISDVLDSLLSLRLRPMSENADDFPSTRLTRWLVSGLLIGGENRTHEKSRLRKGLPILVSTPGRLLDHLQNTSSFNVGKCRWLVLDEADRLMDLGFEDSIKGILQALDGRRRLAIQAVEQGQSSEVGGWDWERRRRTVLCSATMKENVQHLAGTALARPIIVKATESDAGDGAQGVPTTVMAPSNEKFTPPSQLLQKYVIIPLKLRLVALVALLRNLLSRPQSRQGSRIIVFLSCTDSVDYHWTLLGNSSIDESSEEGKSDTDANENSNDTEGDETTEEKIALSSPLFPNTSLYRLHGSLPLQTRLRSLKGFSSAEKQKSMTDKSSPSSAILLCTSVASRGLDLPLVRAVIQYDLPTEGGATEYVHRVGRTARAGKGGEAWAFVAPNEAAWVQWTEERIEDKSDNIEIVKRTSLVSASVDSVLRSGFGGSGSEYESRATQVQLSFERWLLKRNENVELARRAFQSHLRAYATHPTNEKHIFHVRHLHMGHLAKAFALREAPSSIAQRGSAGAAKAKKGFSARKGKIEPKITMENRHKDRGKIHGMGTDHDNSAERRMQEVVRKQGRLVKQDGVLIASGTNDFQIAGGYDLERLVSQGG